MPPGVTKWPSPAGPFTEAFGDSVAQAESLTPYCGPHFVHVNTWTVIISLAFHPFSPADDHESLKTWIKVDSTQLIAVNFPTERTGRFLFNNLISSPSFYSSHGCWQVTEPQILHIQNERIRTNPNSLLELTLCNFGPCPVTCPVSQWFQLLGVGLKFSGAYCMVGAAVGPGCLSLGLAAVSHFAIILRSRHPTSCPHRLHRGVLSLWPPHPCSALRHPLSC